MISLPWLSINTIGSSWPKALATLALILPTEDWNSENLTVTVFHVSGLPPTTSAIKTFLSININKAFRLIYNAQYAIFQNNVILTDIADIQTQNVTSNSNKEQFSVYLYLPLHHLWSSSSGSRLKRRCWGTGGAAAGWAAKCEGHRVMTLPVWAFVSGALSVHFIVPTVLVLVCAKHTVLPREYASVVVVCQINTVCVYLKKKFKVTLYLMWCA